MADKDKDQTTFTEQKPDEKTTQPYAGKFTSVEELEGGYKELEKKVRGSDERMADLEKKYEELVTYQEPELVAQEPVVQTTTDPAKANSTEFLARFYADPEGVLAERERATEVRNATTMNNRFGAQRMMDTYYRDNPDLQKHEDLLDFQFTRQSDKLPPQERLDRAGKRVREMLVVAKGTKEPGSDQLTADNYVEEPTGQGTVTPVVQEKVLSADEELKDFVRQQRADQARGAVPPDLRPQHKK